jgi:ATP-dependent helicase/nuclease subunit A
VIADTPNGVPSVSVASYISEADEDSRTRESEETKRLLYVAVTRARDALYLATVTKEGEIRPTKGSLGEVLPPSVRGLFSASVKSDKAISWQGPSGQRHAFRNVSAGAETPAIVRPRADLAVSRDVFGPLAVRADVPRIAATTFVASTAAARGGTESAAGSRGDAVIGTVVHRMFQARVPAGNKDEAARAARRLLRPEDRVRIDDEETMIQDAAATYMALASHEEVARILASGSCHYEVPFSVIAEPVAGGVLGQADLTGRAIVRGTIDCLVRRSDGSVFVLEFKTGRPRPEHQRQLEIYVSAVRAMFSGSDVTGAVIYP